MREGLSDARAKFENENQEKYQAMCELIHFSERYGRAETTADKPIVNQMSEQLTKIAGELFEERALKDHAVPSSVEISIKAYEEYSARINQEKVDTETSDMIAKKQQEQQTQQEEQSMKRGIRM